MTSSHRHGPEFILVAAVSVISTLGFWGIYFGPDADPQPRHHLHLATTFLWLLLLLLQLGSVSRRRFLSHRRLGLVVLFVGPLLVATTATLSVISAHRAFMAGEGDFLIVQNVMVTVQFGLLVFLAFVFKKQRLLHGSLLFSTLILFGGIALFFTLLTFVPVFRIDGPETFYRFGTAAMTGQVACLGAGALLFASNPRARWPYLLAAGFFLLNEGINRTVMRFDLLDPATRAVGSLNPFLTFAVAFAIQLALLSVAIGPIFRRPRSVALKAPR